MNKTVSLVFASAALLAISGCASNHGTSPKGLEVPIEKAAIKFAADTRASTYRVVGTEELKKWVDSGQKPLIISSLPVEEDKQLGLIPGAVNAYMPKSEKEVTRADREKLLKAAGSDKDRLIVVYCGFVSCSRSHHGANILIENGYRNVYRYPAGITGWLESGYPVTK